MVAQQTRHSSSAVHCVLSHVIALKQLVMVVVLRVAFVLKDKLSIEMENVLTLCLVQVNYKKIMMLKYLCIYISGLN